LQKAVGQGELELVKWLVDHKADLKIKDADVNDFSIHLDLTVILNRDAG